MISIIIPTYNTAKYVTEAIDSALAQTYKDYEIIVIDDGSTDNTEEVLQPYMDRIRYIKKENGGPASARNLGIKEAQGEFLAFLDADDLWLADKLEWQMKFMTDDVGMIGYSVGCEETDDINYVKFEDLIVQNKFCNTSVLIRKSCLDEIGNFDEGENFKAVEDWDMWLRLAKRFTVVHLNRKIVDIRVTEGSISAPTVANAAKMLKNEQAVLEKNCADIETKKKKQALSYRYFCAAWAFNVAGDLNNAVKTIWQGFWLYPSDYFNKKQGALMIKIFLKKILGTGIPVNKITKPFFNLMYKMHVFLRETILFLRRFFYNEPLFRSQCKSVGYGLWMEELPYMSGKGEIIIGNKVRLSGRSSIAFNSKYGVPLLEIGDNTFIGHQSHFAIAKRVTIGKNCFIASSVRIIDNDGHPSNPIQRRQHEPVPEEGIKPVIIGDDVWLGSEALILKGVTIGNNAIIGTRAVVTKDVPENAIVAGNPAKVIKYINE